VSGAAYAAVFPLVRTRAFAQPFDYSIPEDKTALVVPGALVVVPLGPQTVLGVVLETSFRTSHKGKVLPLHGIVDLPPVPEELLALAWQVRDYYITSTASALALVTPPAAAMAVEKRFALTPGGEAALEAGETALAPFATGLPARRADAAAVRRFRRKAWIEAVYELRVGRSGTEPRLLGRGAETPVRLGARQRAVLAALEERGQADERVLRELSGLSAAGLERLLALGAIALAESAAGSARSRVAGAPACEVGLPLVAEQQAALDDVLRLLGSGREVLLHGVTGSGKTEVYLRAAAEVLAVGKSVLVLVPEIGLTGQTVRRFQRRFAGERISVLHSGLSAGERLAAYRQVAEGRSRLVIGARSAIFAPVRDLGLIVVDEEHDGSYKQENEPRYDARTVAAWRGLATGAVVASGSATPSVEAFARIAAHADMHQRVDGSLPPRLEVIDMRDIHGLLSPALSGAITTAVEAGEKVMLLLNRRGLAAYLVCNHCGHTWECPRCDISLTLFGGGRSLRCRLCGHGEATPGDCPQCGSVDLSRIGYGTERLENEVAAMVPGVELLRLDSDVASSYARLRAVLDRFAEPGGKILVGTQMIAKGHHFPEVTLVGVVNADQMLHLPDFRAEERTFAMLLQVGGRSGRGERPGRVIVQTLAPEARAIVLAARADEERFYREEVERRRELDYPPASTLIAIEVTSADADKAQKAADFVAERLRQLLGERDAVLGPGPLRRERARHGARVVIKTANIGETGRDVARFARHYGPRFAARGARLIVDVEPQWL
jgi:primosomal protein N' (replication factor Y)